MLADWYFTARISAPPHVAAALVTAIDILEGRAARLTTGWSELAGAAIDELAAAEPHVRAYALPAVLASRGAPEGEGELDGPVRQYAKVVVDGLPGELRGIVAPAMDRLFTADSGRALDGVADAARRLVGRAHGSPSPAPYLDLQEFAPELVLLAIARACSREAPDLRIEGGGSLDSLLRDAVRGAYGRGCQTLAAGLLPALASQRASEVLDDLLRQARSTALLEPDLIRCVVSLSFHDELHHTRRADPLIDESVLLRVLSRLRSQLDLRRAGWPEDARDTIGVLGLDPAPAELASTVLWQLVLWELAAEVDPRRAAFRLGELLRPPAQRKSVEVTLPAAERGAEEWRREIHRLAAIRDRRPVQIPIVRTVRGQWRDNRDLAAAVFSPWLIRKDAVYEQKIDGQYVQKFHQLQYGIALVRLFVAAVVGNRLLDHATDWRRQNLVGLVLHAEDVSSDRLYRNPIAAAAKQDRAPDPSDVRWPVATLMLLARREADRAGCGDRPGVDPALFVDYILAEEKHAPLQVARLRHEPARHIVRRFLDDVLSNAVPDATDAPAGSWYVDPVTGRRRSRDLVRRFLEDAGIPEPEKWSERKYNWSLAARLRVLYGERVPGTSWHEEAEIKQLTVDQPLAAAPLPLTGWAKKDLDALSSYVPPLLAVKTERLIELIERRPEATDAQAREWSAAWTEQISAMSSPADLSRLQRRRLLTLLGLPPTGEDWQRAVLETMIDTLVELGLGTPIDRWNLFAELTAATHVLGDLADTLRQRFLQSLYAWRSRDVSGRRLRDPRIVARDRRNELLLDDLLVRFLADLGALARQQGRETAAALVPGLWARSRGPSPLLEKTVSLESLAAGEPVDVDRRLLVGMVPDRSGGRMRLHLLKEPRPEPGKEIGVLASADGHFGQVNCGPNARRVALPDGAAPGAVLAVDPVPRAGADSEFHEAYPVLPRPRDGEVRGAEVWLRAVPGEERVAVSFRVDGEPDQDDIGDGERDLAAARFWAPDLVSMFGGRPGEPRPCLVRWSDEHVRWLPAELGFTEFVAAVSAEPTETVHRLTVIDVLDDGALRCKRALGDNLIVPPRAWAASAAAPWARIREEWPSLEGLTFFARLEREEEIPRLALAGRAAGDGPFDDRSLRWKGFIDSALAEAIVRDGRWVVETGIPGFPPITATIVGAEQWQGVCAFTPGPWAGREHRTATIRGQLAQGLRLDLGSVHDTAALDRVLLLREEDELVLRGCSSKIYMGAFDCYTTGCGLEIKVEAESLYLGALNSEKPTLPRPFAEDRRVRVLRVVKTPAEMARHRPVSDDELLVAVPEERLGPIGRDVETTGLLEGVVIEVNRSGDGGRRVLTRFRTRSGAFDYVLPPDALVGAAVRPGWLVEAAHGPAGWTFRLHKRRIFARAVWEIRTLDGDVPPRSSLFLGALEGGDRVARGFAQAAEAPVIYQYRIGDTVPQHLEQVGGGNGADQRIPRSSVAAGTVFHARDRERDPWRVECTDESNGKKPRTWFGYAYGKLNGHVIVTGVRLQIEPLPGDGGVFVIRSFDTSGRPAPSAPGRAAPRPAGLRDGYSDYCDRGRPPLTGRYLEEEGGVRLDTDWGVPLSGQVSRTVPLVQGERTLVTGRYSDRMRVVLVEDTAGEIRASFQRVPPMDLAEFANLLREAGVDPSVRAPLPFLPFYYAGKDASTVAQHRFEWGRGLVLHVDEANLTVDGVPKSETAGGPFYGDAITAVRIREDDLNISFRHIDPGELTYIRRDRDKDGRLGIVHAAKVHLTSNGPRIVGLDTRSPWPLKDDGTYRDASSRDMRAHRLTLTVQARRVLGRGRRESERTVLVRLDTEEFDRTGGTVVRFDCVAPVLSPTGLPDGWHPLRDGECLFLRAGRIHGEGGNVRLSMYADAYECPPGIEPVRVYIERQHFSEREDLLRRLQANGLAGRPGPESLQKSVFLTKVRRPRRAGSKIAEGMLTSVPARGQRVLEGYLRSRPDNAALAVIGSVGGRVRLEIEPNFLFAVDRTRMDVSEKLERGTVVLLRLRPDRRFNVQVALQGDDRYVPKEGRPAILLPKQSLLGTRTLAAALEHGNYLIGGLPGRQVRALAAEPSEPERAEATRLVCTPHPKVSWVVRTGPHELVPVRRPVRAATIDPAARRLLPVTEPPDRPRWDWAQLTYLDAGTTGISERIRTAHWTYHETETSHRTADAPDTVGDPVRLPQKATATEEPVFFTERWSLRYSSKSELDRFGHPPTALIEMPPGTTLEVYVAAITGSIYGGSVWVETAPGRVVEVRSIMLTAGSTGHQTPLDAMDLSDLGPGDMLKLRKPHSRNELKISAVVLADWKPGLRSSLGWRRALLPAHLPDDPAEGLVLGTGEWSMRYPVEEGETLPPFVWLDPANRLRPAAERPVLERDDVVLMGVDGDGKRRLLGLPGVPVVWDGSAGPAWQNELAADNPAALIEAVGGALPVTVVGEEGGAVVVGRSAQEAVPNGPVPRSRPRAVAPLGHLPDGRLVLRHGRRLAVISAGELIPGLPPGLFQEAIRLLEQDQPMLWLTDGRDAPVPGLPGPAGDVRVRALGTLGEGNELGLLCWEERRARACWLPAAEAAWAELPAEELHKGLVQPGRELTVRDHGERGVSLVAAATNHVQLARLALGDFVNVERVPSVPRRRTGPRYRHLGRLQMTDVLVEYLSEEAEPAPGLLHLAEVEERSTRPPRLRVAAPSARIVTMDVPRAVLEVLNGRTAEVEALPAEAGLEQVCELIRRTGSAEDGVLRPALSAWLTGPDGWTDRARNAFGIVPIEPRPLRATQLLALAVALDELASAPGAVEAAGTAAVLVTRELGLRAMRSQHLPLLLDLSRPSERGRGGLWQRLDALLDTGRSKDGWNRFRENLFPGALSDIRNVTDGIRLRTEIGFDRHIGLRAMNEAIAVAIGTHMAFEEVHFARTPLSPLVALGRVLAPPLDGAPAQHRLLRFQRGLLETAHGVLLADLPFLELLPVPPLLQDSYGSRRSEALAALVATVDVKPDDTRHAALVAC